MSAGEIQDTQLTSRDVTTIMSVLILLLPWGLIVTEEDTTIYWIFWYLAFEPTGFNFRAGLPIYPVFLSAVCVRLIFCVLMSRLYSERSTVKRVLSVGVIAEYHVVFYTILLGFNVYILPAWPVMIGIPTPFLLLSTLFLLKRRPPPRYDDSWLLTQKKESLESISSPNPDQYGS